MSNKDTIQIISFNGSASNWPNWELKFLARAQQKDFAGILKGTVQAPPAAKSLDVSKLDEKILKKHRDVKNYAYKELLLLIMTTTDEGHVAFHIVTGSVTLDLPDGDVELLWKRLKDRYVPKLTLKKLELRRAFQVSRLKNSNQDPEVWITYLEGLRMKLKDLSSTMTDEDVIVHILNNLTDDYEVQLSKTEEKLGSTTNLLSIDNVGAELQLKFAQMRMKKNIKNKEKETEKALAAASKYKGTCTFCRKIGHKAVDCYSRKKEESNGNN